MIVFGNKFKSQQYLNCWLLGDGTNRQFTSRVYTVDR